MRGLLVLFLLSVHYSQVVYSQSNVSLLEEELISGNGISSITEWNHAFRGEEPAETGTMSLRANYDPNGYMVEETSFNSKGEQSRKVTSRFDNSGNRIQHSVYDLRNNRLTFSQAASFNQQGNKISEWGFDGLGDYRNNYKYNSDGKVSEIQYTTQGSLSERRVFTYIDNETRVEVILPDNTIKERIILLNNNRGDLLLEAYYDNEQNLIRKVEYGYNASGLKTEERRYHGQQMQYRDAFIYENDLLQRIIRTDRQGQETVINKYSYNTAGQLIEEAWYNENADNYSTREYSWDDHGNMTSVECYFASYQFRVLYRYDYSFF